MKFNPTRYQELLTYSNQLKKEQKNLFRVSKSDFLELLDYFAAIDSQLTLESYQLYANLIEKFLEVKISSGELAVEFFKIEELHKKILDRLKSNYLILLPNEQADLVGELITDISWILQDLSFRDDICSQFSNEFKREEALNNFESRIYTSIREIYLQLESIVKNYQENSKFSYNFLELLDQLNWINRELYIELIQKYLDGSSSSLNLKETYQSVVEVAEELESNSIPLKLNYQALGFSNYLLILIQLLDRSQIDSNITSYVLKNWVRKILFEIKNHYS